MNFIILSSIFAKLQDIFTTGRVKLVYDPKLQELKNTVKSLQENDAFYVHYPSYLNIRSKEGRKLLTNHVSWVRFD